MYSRDRRSWGTSQNGTSWAWAQNLGDKVAFLKYDTFHTGFFLLFPPKMFKSMELALCWGSTKINKFCLFLCMEWALNYVLLHNFVEKGAFTSQNSQNTNILWEKNQKKLSGKSAHIFSLPFFGVSSNGRTKSHTSFENLFLSGFIICNQFLWF